MRYSLNNITYIKKHIKIKILSLLDIFKLLYFFIEIDYDLEARRFYRFMPCHSLIMRIKSFIFLTYRLSVMYYIFRKKYLLIVGAYINGKLIGICHIDIDLKKKIGVYGIAILRKYRGLGLGKLLSIKAINLAVFHNIKYIVLTVDHDNKKAINMYKRLGFVEMKRIENGDYRYITGNHVDVILMMKPLYKISNNSNNLST